MCQSVSPGIPVCFFVNSLIRQRHLGVFLCVLQAHQPQCASTRIRDNRLGKPDASAFRLIKSGAAQLNDNTNHWANDRMIE
jgi:hypothetical protein